jgi:hypothetical protein
MLARCFGHFRRAARLESRVTVRPDRAAAPRAIRQPRLGLSPSQRRHASRGRMTGIRYKDLVRRSPNDRAEELLLASFPARSS